MLRSTDGNRLVIKVAVPALLAALALGLTGCDSKGAEQANSAASSGPSVIAPGKPGEAAETLSAQDAQRRGADDKPNSADVRYAQMMIQHHEQALKMTGLAPEQAESGALKRLAERIAAAQGPEVAVMRGWLKQHGRGAEPEGHDGHEAMPGMASEAQLKSLRAARGKAFDTLFLKLMITHHQGAVTMATDVKSQGNDVQVEEMADDVIAQQTTEISRMRDMS
ncbi:DUF305 domain-containing protein [Streptomyces kunmingensis]|uniref:DUF305 domain-containing protein n=1 Tax=Streptomyces kunmingensis TaxID=68225 RepID=A0ABU6CK27_9ACTN|nr:DUF305 domain-containing protein [Streptomyces kunmingensis]MEB3965043.1 DUF305 domain-containing protein [Streptomyces kunmingensis]